jgi:hypothetical protein
MSDIFKWPKQICTQEELDHAKAHGRPIEGRDGDYIVGGYELDGKIYLTRFEESPLPAPPQEA